MRHAHFRIFFNNREDVVLGGKDFFDLVLVFSHIPSTRFIEPPVFAIARTFNFNRHTPCQLQVKDITMGLVAVKRCQAFSQLSWKRNLVRQVQHPAQHYVVDVIYQVSSQNEFDHDTANDGSRDVRKCPIPKLPDIISETLIVKRKFQVSRYFGGHGTPVFGRGRIVAMGTWPIQSARNF
ncbi:hypothetical protein PspCFBP13528_18310 [Pseudomonas sp. CFBP13528]|nr:hypothetical protein PspCFBP13528_18310 [Pseudomonas sp. CFBP13528]